MYRVVMTMRELGPDSYIQVPVPASSPNQTNVYGQISTPNPLTSTIKGNVAVAIESVLVNSEELALEAVAVARSNGMYAFHFKVKDDER